jgi:hypothetical protein
MMSYVRVSANSLDSVWNFSPMTIGASFRITGD